MTSHAINRSLCSGQQRLGPFSHAAEMHKRYQKSADGHQSEAAHEASDSLQWRGFAAFVKQSIEMHGNTELAKAGASSWH